MHPKQRLVLGIIALGALRSYPTYQRFTTNAQNTSIVTDYDQQSYDISTQHWSKLANSCQGFSFCADILHNLGNSYFFVGKEASDSQQQQKLRHQALESYSGSLSIEYDRQTQHNHDELAKLLGEPPSQEPTQDSETQEEGEESTSDQEDTENTSEGENSGEGGQEGEQSGTETNQQSEEGGNEGDGQGDSEAPGGQNQDQSSAGEEQGSPSEQPSSLSESQRQQLEQYAQMLEQQQRQNQQFFNKESANRPQDPFESLFGIPNFRQQINPNSNQKDW